MLVRGYTEQIEGVRAILDIVPTGELHDEWRANTPRRVVNSFRDMLSGYKSNPSKILSTTFDLNEANDQLIVVTNMRFVSLCAHHLLPFHGTASIAYLPNDKVVGLSKIPRLLECRSRRLQLQETLGYQLATDLNTHLSPKGVAVVIASRHDCMTCRGVRSADGEMVTSVMLGLFRSDMNARLEVINILKERAG